MVTVVMMIVSVVVHVLFSFSLFFLFYVENVVQPLRLLVLVRFVVVSSVALLLANLLSADLMLHWGLPTVFRGWGLWLLVYLSVV